MIITIFVSDESKIKNVFNKIKSDNAIDIHTSSSEIVIYLEHDEIRITTARDGVRGWRHNYVFIDKDIKLELVDRLIIPKIIPIYTIFGVVHLYKNYEFIDVNSWNGRISLV
jgi:hypothetical protein